MKKRSQFVPLEISGSELEAFVYKLKEKLYSEFWSEPEQNPQKDEIKARIEKNIYSVLESSLR